MTKKKPYFCPECEVIVVEYRLMEDDWSITDGGDGEGETDDDWAKENIWDDDDFFVP